VTTNSQCALVVISLLVQTLNDTDWIPCRQEVRADDLKRWWKYHRSHKCLHKAAKATGEDIQSSATLEAARDRVATLRGHEDSRVLANLMLLEPQIAEQSRAEQSNAKQKAQIDQMTTQLQELTRRLEESDQQLADTAHRTVQLEQEHTQLIEKVAECVELKAEIEDLGRNAMRRNEKLRTANQDAAKWRDALLKQMHVHQSANRQGISTRASRQAQLAVGVPRKADALHDVLLQDAKDRTDWLVIPWTMVRLLRQAGKGADCVAVYAAKLNHVLLQRQTYAVKVLQPGCLPYEDTSIHTLSSSLIPTLAVVSPSCTHGEAGCDCDKMHRCWAIVYPYCDAGTLHRPKLPDDVTEAEFLGMVPRLLFEIGEGLEVMHSEPKPMIHNDFHGGNILLARSQH
jgi:hypothetical protein